MDGLQRSVPGGRYRGTRGVPIGTPPVANLLLHAAVHTAVVGINGAMAIEELELY